ncbi:MAG: ATP-dependent Clp protease ATP-binding subunit, partial [Spirochaeta sp.]
IMTSNAGAREITRESAVGFRTGGKYLDYQEIKSSAMNELRKLFRPEFINRADEIVVFSSLSENELQKILDILLGEVQVRLSDKEIGLEISANARRYLIENGYDPKYGARPLRRLIQREIEDPLAIDILRGRFGAGSRIKVTMRNDKLSFRETGTPETASSPDKVVSEV